MGLRTSSKCMSPNWPSKQCFLPETGLSGETQPVPTLRVSSEQTVCVCYCHSVPWKYHHLICLPVNCPPLPQAHHVKAKAFTSHIPPLSRAPKGPMTSKTHRSNAEQDAVRWWPVIPLDSVIGSRSEDERKKIFICLVDVFPSGDRRDGFGWLPPMPETHTLSIWTRPNFIDFITLPRYLAWAAKCNPRRCLTLTFS